MYSKLLTKFWANKQVLNFLRQLKKIDNSLFSKAKDSNLSINLIKYITYKDRDPNKHKR